MRQPTTVDDIAVGGVYEMVGEAIGGIDERKRKSAGGSEKSPLGESISPLKLLATQVLAAHRDRTPDLQRTTMFNDLLV